MTGLTSSNGDLTCLLPGYQNEIVYHPPLRSAFLVHSKKLLSAHNRGFTQQKTYLYRFGWIGMKWNVMQRKRFGSMVEKQQKCTIYYQVRGL